MQQDNHGIATPRDGVMYDPNIRGFDTSFWNKLAGTVAENGSVPNKVVRITDGDIISFTQYKYGTFDFAINIPNSPSGSEARVWGLRFPSTTRGAIYFEISSSVFQVVSRNDAGTATTKAITWDSFDGAEAIFRIVWTPSSVSFLVDDVLLTTLSVADGDNIPTLPIPLRIDSNEADNVDIGYVLVQNAATIIS